MGMNNITIQGVIPKSDKLQGAFEYYNTDPNKTSMLSFLVSVRRSFKAADEKFYPEDLIPCKAFGKTADHIAKFFGKGQPIQLTGSLLRDDPYEDSTGKKQSGHWYIKVAGSDFIDGMPKIDAAEQEAPAATKTVVQVAAAPRQQILGRGALAQPVGGNGIGARR